jgi:Protein of unknown function (DUF2637)
MNADQTRSPSETGTAAMPIIQFADPMLRRGLSVVIGLMAAAVAGIAALAFWTSFEAILDFATHHGEQDYGWRVPLLVDTFVLVATLADLWCSATRTGLESKWQRVVLWWPKLLLAAAVVASFAFNVGHAKPDLGNRAVAAMPPAALVVSFELLMFITRRAIAARVARLAAATTTDDDVMVAEAFRIESEGDQATTPPMVAATNDRPALPPRPTVERTTSDRQATQETSRGATSAPARGATYHRVRELYEGGMTVAAHIARELGVSASYAQRTLRQVKADLAQQATTRQDGRATSDQPTEQATSGPDRQQATRLQDEQASATERADEATTAERRDQPTAPERGDQATTTDRDDHATTRATTNGEGRPTGDGQRHLSLIRDREADRGEVPSR